MLVTSQCWPLSSDGLKARCWVHGRVLVVTAKRFDPYDRARRLRCARPCRRSPSTRIRALPRHGPPCHSTAERSPAVLPFKKYGWQYLVNPRDTDRDVGRRFGTRRLSVDFFKKRHLRICRRRTPTAWGRSEGGLRDHLVPLQRSRRSPLGARRRRAPRGKNDARSFAFRRYTV